MAEVTDFAGEMQEVIRRLVDNLQPEQIYLFGSYARGTQISGQSDVDLLVVVPQSDLPRHQREARSYDALWGLTTPVDLVVLTKEEFDRTKRVKTSLASTVQKQGMLVYG